MVMSRTVTPEVIRQTLEEVLLNTTLSLQSGTPSGFQLAEVDQFSSAPPPSQVRVTAEPPAAPQLAQTVGWA